MSSRQLLRTRFRRLLGTAAAVALAVGTGAATVPALSAEAAERSVRFATYNASLNRSTEGQLLADLSTPNDPQARRVAEVIQRARPDVLLLNEFDYVSGNRAVNAFRCNYLERPGADPAVRYPYSYTAPVNTGVPSGLDLDNNGTVGGGNDAYGFGLFPGQYGMVVLSRYPIDTAAIRTFTKFRWADMPGALLPDDPSTSAPRDWFSPAELKKVRLSSKSHWDVPIRAGGSPIHFLVSHPTPPVFDGPEDRNGRRNHDEIRLWADYISGPRRSGYLYDDRGRRGGLASGGRFVIAGDLNSDLFDGDSLPGSVQQVVRHPRVNTSRTPTSLGGQEAAQVQGGINLTHRTPPKYDTADFSEPPGNLRADYVLPSTSLKILGAQVLWPMLHDPFAATVNQASDHRLVWTDLRP